MSIFEQPTQCGCNKPDCYFCWLRNRIYATTALEKPEKAKEPDLNDILQEVSEKYGISVENITGKSRKTEIVAARQMFCYIAKNKGKWTLKQICKTINVKQHGTVIHACKATENMLYTDKLLKTR